MRLVRKLILAIILGMSALFVTHGIIAARREAALYEQRARIHEDVLANVLGFAVADIWRTEGEARALELIRAADIAEDDVRMRWLWLDGSDDGAPPLIPAASVGGGLTRDTRMVGSERVEITVVPIVIGARRGAIEIVESLAAGDSHVRGILIETGFTTLALAAFGALMAFVLGRVLIARPVEALAAKARRIGDGDLEGPITLPGDHELVDLAREVNAMCERLSTARDRIEQESAARIAILEQLRHADRLTTVGKLASGIAHELGTPLNVVKGRAKMISAGRASEEETRSFARIIEEQVDRMVAIIRQLLDFARRRRPAKAACDLLGVATETCDLLEPLARKRGVRLHVSAASREVIAEVDVGAIQQALTNLIVNATQASQEGGEVVVEVTRARATPPAEIGGEARDFATLSVTDRGSGIPEQDLPRIFEPFFTTKEVGDGTGLGLSVAFGIARDHDGFITAESTLGSGSAFVLHLPA